MLILALLWFVVMPSAMAMQGTDSAHLGSQVQGERSTRVVSLGMTRRAQLEIAIKPESVVRDNLIRGARLLRKVQAEQYKSRREVIEEVERTYQAKVLKVSLDQNAGVYEVRILQADGRVRTIRVSAYN